MVATAVASCGAPRAADPGPGAGLLADGLRVPSGFRLVATPFPRRDGWQALLVDTGPPTAALRALVRDIGAVAPAGSVRCGSSDFSWVYAGRRPVHFTECVINAVAAATRITTTFRYGETTLGPSPGRATGPRPVAMACIRMRELHRPRPPATRLAAPHLHIPARPLRPLPVPSAGQLAGVGLAPTGVRVEPGSVAVASPLGGMGAFDLVLRVTGDPARVFAAYEHQLVRRAGTAVRVHRHNGRSALGRWRAVDVNAAADSGNSRMELVTTSQGAFLDIWAD